MKIHSLSITNFRGYRNTVIIPFNDLTVFVGKNKDFWERNRRSGGYLLKKRLGQIAISVIRGLLLFGLCFMIIQPMLTRLSTSLMQEKDLYDSTVVLVPRNPTLDNFRIVFDLTNCQLFEMEQAGCQCCGTIGLLKSFSKVPQLTCTARCDYRDIHSINNRFQHRQIKTATHTISIDRVQTYLTCAKLFDFFYPINKI